IPGKEEFHDSIRYFRTQLEVRGVDVRLNTRASVSDLVDGGFDQVILATGVTPRIPEIDGV
ncbi:MAG TPA: hypothetical protein DCM55_03295, partial [Corynebacterium variabile]|nr:hypothetical protein [Corynebacterium variabile]